MKKNVETQIEEIKNAISTQVALQKEILTLSEAAIYAGISRSFIYKLTSKRQIPFYRPMSKLIFFKKSELDSWLLQNRLNSRSEAMDQLTSKKGGTL